MQLLGVDAQSVPIAHVDGDGFAQFQVADVLVDKSQRGVGRPLGDYVLLNLRGRLWPAADRSAWAGGWVSLLHVAADADALRCHRP
jgi:hypothetical protein